MHEIDPYSHEESVYECLGCGSRVATTDHLSVCPDCGDDVRNIAVPRE